MVGTQISRDQGRELVSNPGFVLEKNAALAWDRAVAAFGKQVLISGAWRSYEIQERLFDGEKFPNQTPQYGRYSRGNRAGQRGYTTDVRGRTADGSLYRGSWWTRKDGTAAAAVPGTSNHGAGRAVDVKTRRESGDPGYATAVIFAGWNDEDRKRFLRIAAKHGWYDTEGRQVDEHWHLTWYPELDQHRGEKPKKTLTPTQEEPDMDATQAKQLSEVHKDVGETEVIVRQLRTKADRQEARIVALTAAVESLASSVGGDAKAITAAVTKSVDKALADLQSTLKTGV